MNLQEMEARQQQNMAQVKEYGEAYAQDRERLQQVVERYPFRDDPDEILRVVLESGRLVCDLEGEGRRFDAYVVGSLLSFSELQDHSRVVIVQQAAREVRKWTALAILGMIGWGVALVLWFHL